MKTKPIKNKGTQSNKNIIIIDLPFNVTIFQSTKQTVSFIIKYTPQKQKISLKMLNVI